ncbi:MAG: protein TolR [Novosphingobium sp. 16-62-11]|uniref:ExbD/TolR family protein n=1 Tax=Novosphingobium sp. 17-62-19 TaxID=1970406 RepID=UPI000BDB265A|nr:ExbD/TolR family protein [Novosphingobium sp. 17-62-19]OYX91954.1 MAG: protein TolR [Novosphingobium sp. 35-62-5]OYZ41812.1 MAG: protein TolR [Novosphingobium sp. 16-62-11]OZA61729.1 MAG: protein TolR [Sphingomonadales bacterium 39-62-4]HQS97870.1 ExbD/TolR family protein [Novosphingobium sp.]OZA18609.1 MAG: protein TolR [Novosphingobium sp. 17-62-19]
MAMSVGGGGSSRNRGRRGRGGRTAMSEINVTPFVDVMLVLLIIFMVTAPMLAAGVPVDLPGSKADPLDQQQDQITVSIDAQGGVFLDDEQLAPGELTDRLAGLQRGEKPPLVTLRADRVLDWGRVAAVMGELNAAGFKSISLVTNSSSAPQ